MISFKLLELLKEVTHDHKTLEAARLQEKAFTRNRRMLFSSALCFMLNMRKTTLQTRLNMYFEHNKKGEPICQQAFSKLRSNFDHSPFVTMLRTIVKREYSGDNELNALEWISCIRNRRLFFCNCRGQRRFTGNSVLTAKGHSAQLPEFLSSLM